MVCLSAAAAKSDRRTRWRPLSSLDIYSSQPYSGVHFGIAMTALDATGVSICVTSCRSANLLLKTTSINGGSSTRLSKFNISASSATSNQRQPPGENRFNRTVYWFDDSVLSLLSFSIPGYATPRTDYGLADVGQRPGWISTILLTPAQCVHRSDL